MKKSSLVSLLLIIGLLFGTAYLISAQQNRPQRQGRQQLDPEQMLQRSIERATRDLDGSEEEVAVLTPFIEKIIRTRTEQSQQTREITTALNAAVEAGDEAAMKAKLDELKAKRKTDREALDKLQTELVELLTLKQEAQLTLAGVVNSDGGIMTMRGFGGRGDRQQRPESNRQMQRPGGNQRPGR